MKGAIDVVQSSLGEQADRLSRRRARMLPFLAIIYLTQQVSFFTDQHGTMDRAVDHVKLSAWVILTLMLLVALATKGFWFRSRELRNMIDDETTRAHRREALQWGFIFSTLTAIALYFVTMMEPVGAREAIHIIVSIGMAAALVRFGALERRALKDG
jgi:heme/copper-type cytochrome/quinol oxidase subunit 2